MMKSSMHQTTDGGKKIVLKSPHLEISTFQVQQLGSSNVVDNEIVFVLAHLDSIQPLHHFFDAP